jgi:hypothetical protein
MSVLWQIAQGQTVTVLRYAPDRYGDRALVSEFTVAHCVFAPQAFRSVVTMKRQTDRANAMSADAQLFVPAGADIRHTDGIRLADGTTWEVTGTPEVWASPLVDWAPGNVVALNRVTG